MNSRGPRGPRSKKGFAWEKELAEILRGRGWLVEHYGQGQLSDDMHDYAHRYRGDDGQETLMRWIPDLIAGRQDIDRRPYLCLLDAKTDSDEHERSPNHSVESKAVEADLAIGPVWNIPIFYVWPGLHALTPAEVDMYGQRRPGSRRNGGSGTPMHLIEKRRTWDANAIFTTATKPISTRSVA